RRRRLSAAVHRRKNGVQTTIKMRPSPYRLNRPSAKAPQLTHLTTFSPPLSPSYFG
ncbi:hypothetical protein COCVIDRAFT_102607, partial [Bipolaris victoriae FI3]